MSRYPICGWLLLGIASLVVWQHSPAAAVEKTFLAQDGQARHAVVVSDDATPRVQQAAQTLAQYLERISQAKFNVEQGDGTAGLAVGLGTDFPALKLAERFAPGDSLRREEYLLRSHDRGMWLIGATELAVEHAVWDTLYRLGYRQFFPGQTWEVVPAERALSIAVDEWQRPDYHGRRIWYGYGAWDYAVEPYADWCAKNRAVQGVELQTGHSYDGIVKGAKSQFDQHPDYWPLLDGERKPVTNPKPCLGNPAVRQLIVEHALARFDADPSLDSISMDPSDGGGWCQCDQCAKLGSVSDQALTMANEVAAAVEARYPGKRVGMYAYAYHSPPPSIEVHPNVVISVATSFLKGGLTLDEIIAGWSARGATLGVREYYGVNVWDRDLPAAARGGNLDYLQRTIPDFHARGARFMSAESSDNWAPNGLGYYLAARMLWDVDEAQRMKELKADFLTRAFGPAAEPMREFFEQLDGSHPHLVADDQLGRMFRSLRQARTAADSDSVTRRIDELTLYAHYCSRFHQYQAAQGAERQTAFETLIRHAYRMRTTMMIHAKALYRDLAARDKSVSIPDGAGWSVPEPKNPWKSSEPFAAGELSAMLEGGIARHKLVELDFEPVAFSGDLVPAAKRLGFEDAPAAGELGPGRGVQTFFTFVEQLPATIELDVTGGLIAHYRDRGNVKIELWRIGGESETGERETLVATDRNVPPDGMKRTVRLDAKQSGLHKLVISDGHDRTRIQWPAGQPMTVLSSRDDPMNSTYVSWSAFFYVPKGTRVIGLFGVGGELLDSQGRTQFRLEGREPNFASLPVPPGEDGRVWRVRQVRGDLRLMTVPPCFATTPRGLLLPKEIVDKENAAR